MSEEKKLILKMLKEGKISEQEALKLLDAIKEPADRDQSTRDSNFDFDSKDLESKVEKFALNVVSGVESLFQKASKKIKNLQFDYDFDMSYEGDTIVSFSNMKSKLDRTYTIDMDEDRTLSLDINNFIGSTSLCPTTSDQIQIKAHIYYNDKYVDEDYDFVKYSLEGDKLVIKSDSREVKKEAFLVNMEVLLPIRAYDSLNVESINGRIELEDLDFDQVRVETVNGTFFAESFASNIFKVKTVNGSISLMDSDFSELELETVNGKVEIDDLLAKKLKVSTVNGKMDLEGIGVEDIQLTSVNGKINLDGNLNKSKKLRLKSVNGSVYIESLEFDKEAKIYCKANSNTIDRLDLGSKFDVIERSKKELIATTHSYKEEDPDKLELEINLQNGRLTIVL
ncbi:MAG: DUF4097 family beta strand repeat-containing protein [Tissierellia bacterium]|nr:DUF4097 family beta strand repeat-containing protein [Tissierellia bacterium]